MLILMIRTLFLQLQMVLKSAMKVENVVLPVMNCALERLHSLQQT